MKAVVIRIGRYDHFVEPQVLNPVFDAQGHHQVVQLFIFVDGRFSAPEHIQRNTFETENRLGQRIPCRNHGSGGGWTLCNEDGGIISIFLMAKVVLAVFEVGYLDGDPAGGFLGFFLDRVEFLS